MARPDIDPGNTEVALVLRMAMPHLHGQTKKRIAALIRDLEAGRKIVTWSPAEQARVDAIRAAAKARFLALRAAGREAGPDHT